MARLYHLATACRKRNSFLPVTSTDDILCNATTHLSDSQREYRTSLHSHLRNLHHCQSLAHPLLDVQVLPTPDQKTICAQKQVKSSSPGRQQDEAH